MAAATPDTAALRTLRGDSPAVLGLVWGLFAFVLYALTCSPGVDWLDAGLYQYRIYVGQLENPLGLALSHPLHYWLGQAALAFEIPGTEPALRINLVSSLFGAIGVGTVAAVAGYLTRNGLAASLGAAAVMISHSYWQMSLIAEVYTIAAALLAIEWLLLLRYAATRRPIWLIALFGVNGLHVADHLLGLLPLATYGILLLVHVFQRRVSLADSLACGIAWFLGSSPYWFLIIRFYLRTGDAAATATSALFGGGVDGAGYAHAVLNLELPMRLLLRSVMSLGYNFPSATLLLVLVGMFWPIGRRGRLVRRMLLAQSIIIFTFVARYAVVDLYTFFVPVCALAGVWYALGIVRLLNLLGGVWRKVLVAALVLNTVLPLGVYAVFPDLARQNGWVAGQLRDIPLREEYSHFFEPWRHEQDAAARYARMALAETGPGGWFLADATVGYAVAFTYLAKGGPPDIRIFAHRECLTEPAAPNLTAAELRAFLRAGGRVVGVPGLIEDLWGADFRLEYPGGPFWYIREPAAPAR